LPLSVNPPDVVGMAVGDDDDVDVFRIVAGLLQARDQLAVRHSATQLFVLPAQGAVAGIEQHQLLTRIHQGWNERMLKTVSLDLIGAGQFLRGLRRLIAADTGMQPVADDLAVHNVGDLEAAELDAVDSGLHLTLRCRHACSLRMLCRGG
jgi:hypothetical protein